MAEDNSSLETVASLVGRRCLDNVLKVICCSLHTQYFSIHVGSFSIDDEPSDEVRDRQSPSRRGSSGDGVGDDMGAKGPVETGIEGGGEGKDGLDGGGGDRDRGSWRGWCTMATRV
jgi:hypothetical protein